MKFHGKNLHNRGFSGGRKVRRERWQGCRWKEISLCRTAHLGQDYAGQGMVFALNFESNGKVLKGFKQGNDLLS